MHLCTLGDKKIIVLSRKNEEIKDTIILDMNGEERRLVVYERR